MVRNSSEQLIIDNPELAAKMYSDESPSLEELLLTCYKRDQDGQLLLTEGCCIGHGPSKPAYITIEVDASNLTFIKKLYSELASEKKFNVCLGSGLVIRDRMVILVRPYGEHNDWPSELKTIIEGLRKEKNTDIPTPKVFDYSFNLVKEYIENVGGLINVELSAHGWLYVLINNNDITKKLNDIGENMCGINRERIFLGFFLGQRWGYPLCLDDLNLNDQKGQWAITHMENILEAIKNHIKWNAESQGKQV